VIAGGSVVRTVQGIAPGHTSAAVGGLANSTSYTFKVIAKNELGLSSEPSAASNAVVPAGSGPSVVASTPAGGATTLRDNAALANVAKVVTYNDATRTLTVNPNANLSPGTSYTLTVSGAGVNGIRDSFGTPLPTTAITFTPTPDLSVPTVTTVSLPTGRPVRASTPTSWRTSRSRSRASPPPRRS
jgi:Bacterial Ig-like domain